MGHGSRGPANQTETAATSGRENTRRVPDPCWPASPGAAELLPHLPAPPAWPTGLPTKHTEARSRRCWSPLLRAVTEVAVPSQALTSHAHGRARPRSGAPGDPPEVFVPQRWVQPSPPPGRLVLPEGGRVGGSADSTPQRPERGGHTALYGTAEAEYERAGPESWEVDRPQRRGRFSEGEKPREKTRSAGRNRASNRDKKDLLPSFLDFCMVTGEKEGRAFYLLPQWKTGAGPRPGRRALGEAWSACSASGLTAA